MTRGKFLVSLGALLCAPFLPALKGADKSLAVRHEEWENHYIMADGNEWWECKSRRVDEGENHLFKAQWRNEPYPPTWEEYIYWQNKGRGRWHP